MKKFSELCSEKAFNFPIEFPSTTVRNNSHALMLRFTSSDILSGASYLGDFDPWLSGMCNLIVGKNLTELLTFSLSDMKSAYQHDESFNEALKLMEKLFFYPHLELLKASLDVYRGQNHLYLKSSPLVCRCFGVRECDILSFLKKESFPSLEAFASFSDAGKGCRTCMPQLKKWLSYKDFKEHKRFYKNRAVADWLLEIENKLQEFSKYKEWNFVVRGLKEQQVTISFDKDVTQLEEEEMGVNLQGYLSGAIDPDLAFFFIRARHLSKAKG